MTIETGSIVLKVVKLGVHVTHSNMLRVVGGPLSGLVCSKRGDVYYIFNELWWRGAYHAVRDSI